MSLTIGPYQLRGPRVWGGTQTPRVEALLLGADTARAAALAVQLEGLARSQAPVPVTHSDRPALDGWYRVMGARATAHDTIRRRWAWEIELERIAHRGGRTHSTLPASYRPDAFALYGGALVYSREWWATPGAATNVVATATGTAAAWSRTGPGGTADLVAGDLGGGPYGARASYLHPPGSWWDMGAQILDATGLPVVLPDTPLDAGWSMSNGLVTLGWTSTWFTLTCPTPGNPSVPEVTPRAWEVHSGTAGTWPWGTVRSARARTIGPAEAVVRLELADSNDSRMVADVGMRRGAWGVTLTLATETGQQMALEADATLGLAVTAAMPGSTTVGRETSGAGNRLCIVPLQAWTRSGSVIYADSSSLTRTSWYVGCVPNGASAPAGDSGADQALQLFAATSEHLAVA